MSLLDPVMYRHLSLLLLTLQQASMPLMVRYSKTQTVKPDYLATSSVFVMDIIRLIFCSTILTMKYGSLQRLDLCPQASISLKSTVNKNGPSIFIFNNIDGVIEERL